MSAKHLSKTASTAAAAMRPRLQCGFMLTAGGGWGGKGGSRQVSAQQDCLPAHQEQRQVIGCQGDARAGSGLTGAINREQQHLSRNKKRRRHSICLGSSSSSSRAAAGATAAKAAAAAAQHLPLQQQERPQRQRTGGAPDSSARRRTHFWNWPRSATLPRSSSILKSQSPVRHQIEAGGSRANEYVTVPFRSHFAVPSAAAFRHAQAHVRLTNQNSRHPQAHPPDSMAARISLHAWCWQLVQSRLEARQWS